MITWMPLTLTLVVRVALAVVNTTKLYSRSSTVKSILSTKVIARKVCLLLESNKTTTGTKWIRIIPMMIAGLAL